MEITLATKNSRTEVKLNSDSQKEGIKLNAHSGKNGSSAYEVALENGFSGTESEWLESLKGEKGDKGDRGREIKSSIVIGNEASGATYDMCDILYKDGDDFVQSFSEASALAGSIGVARVEILSGQYKANGAVIIDVCEVAGIGKVEIISVNAELDGSFIKLNGNKVSLENMVFNNGKGNTVNGSNCKQVYMKNIHIIGTYSSISTRVCLENCIIDGELMIYNADNSFLTNCEIQRLNAGIETDGAIITGCKIGRIVNLTESNILRNNIIGTDIQKPSILEHLMNISFGRITTENQQESISRNIEANSFEVYVNEKKNMTVNLYTGNSPTPAKTLSSEVFIFLSGNKGEDIVDGDVYQKTLILYMKSTLGVASIGKWIAVSDSDVYENVRIEIICPANTYRGVIQNKTETVSCND